MNDTALWVVGNVMAIYAAITLLISDAPPSSIVVLGVIGIVFMAVGARSRRTRIHH